MTGTLTPRRPADSTRLANLELVKNEIIELPDEFYGVVEFHFNRGQILHMKTATTKKFNPEAKPPEVINAQQRR